jgi:hypothetical protein
VLRVVLGIVLLFAMLFVLRLLGFFLRAAPRSRMPGAPR